MRCYRKGSCGPYEMLSCSECPASKPEYALRGSSPSLPRLIELMEIERECIIRNTYNDCNRQCDQCDLVQDSAELISTYTRIISILDAMKERCPT